MNEEADWISGRMNEKKEREMKRKESK